MMFDGFLESPSLPPSLDLVEELNHRVINEYAEAISLIALAAARSEDATAREVLAHAASRLRAHAETHRALLPPSTEGAMNLADYISQLCGSLANAALADKGVHIELSTSDVLLPAHRCWRVGLILAELVRNAARHGLPGGAEAISIRLLAGGDHVHCLVSNSACDNPDPAPGRGRRLVQSLAAELGGDVQWRFTPVSSLAWLRIPATAGQQSGSERST